MNKFITENKSIIFSTIITLCFYIIVFCIIKFDLSIIENNSDKIINNNFIEIQISQTNTKSKKSETENIENIKTKIEQKKETPFTKETKLTEEIINTEEKNFIETENTNSDKSENKSESFYPVEVAKQITEDVIDRKIIENLFYPEKATRRGIEGKIIIKVEISKNGNLLNYEIISKNNNQILEDASISTINKIFPIKELEIKNTVENFSTIITFVYKLN